MNDAAARPPSSGRRSIDGAPYAPVSAQARRQPAIDSGYEIGNGRLGTVAVAH
jgi:hypothetical protein